MSSNQNVSHKTAVSSQKRTFIKDVHFHISLNILIPLIFAGLCVFSALVASALTEYVVFNRLDSKLTLWVGIFVVGGIAYVCGTLIVRFLLKPVETFVEKTRDMPFISSVKQTEDGSYVDRVDEFTHVFQQVETVLSKIDAHRLFPDIIGESRAIRGVFRRIVDVATTDATVLISGESGTGKELVANHVRSLSLRKDKPFVKINCAGIPEGLLESELFGYEKGAFTDASARKIGKFEIADGGTVFLDEIGDMPQRLQAKLLRVLQEKEFERVGGTKPIKIDVRFIAATHQHLPRLVRHGKFREDLYYRLNVFPIMLPPLRERKDDIPLLADDFLRSLNPSVQISEAAIQHLLSYSWPGNVRELQNIVEASAIIADNTIRPEDLPLHVTGRDKAVLKDSHALPEASQNHCLACLADGLDAFIKQTEKAFILEALKKTGGVQVRAAEILGINKRSLWHRIAKYEIDVSAIKSEYKA